MRPREPRRMQINLTELNHKLEKVIDKLVQKVESMDSGKV